VDNQCDEQGKGREAAFEKRRGGQRRRDMRFVVEGWAEVLVLDGTMLFRGLILDLSVVGCYIETQARLRLEPGTPVEIIFRVKGTMVRTRATSREVRAGGAGFLFSNLNRWMWEEMKGLIVELKGQDKKPTINDRRSGTIRLAGPSA
jgi:hypothetical protein